MQGNPIISEGPGVEPVTGTITNIQRFSIEDGPGIRTTVFTKGCPLRCIWCHNPEGLSIKHQIMWFDVRCIGARDCLEACPRDALLLDSSGIDVDRESCDACGLCAEACPAGAIEVVGRDVTAREVFEEVVRDEAFYRNSDGGVTVSGGEPSMQPAFVAGILELCGEAGIHRALDTCAFCSREVLSGLLELSDMVLLDLKTMDREKHREFTGVDLDPILDNVRYIDEAGKPVWVRTPVIPGCTDSEDNLGDICAFLSTMNNVERYDLLAFNNMCESKYRRLDIEWKLSGKALIQKSRMEEMSEMAEKAGVENVHWSGVTKEEP